MSASPRYSRLRLILGTVVLPLLLAVIAAESYLALRERRPAHVLDGHIVTPFPSENEATVHALRDRGVRAYPFVAPQQFSFRQYPRKNVKGGLFPLAGISNAVTELCNEAGRDIIYRSDIHGFNNPPEAWRNGSPKVALIGDSFVHGVCVAQPDQLATLIRNVVPATLNLGVLGAGPLSDLAVLREYAAPLRSKIVLWFFYEGNDIEDLAKEVDSRPINYLSPEYSQKLIERQSEIDAMLMAFADSVLSAKQVMTPGFGDVPEMLTFPRVRKAIDMVEANAPNQIDFRRFAVLQIALQRAKQDVESWGGKLYVVYLPDYHRFDQRALAYSGYVHNNAEIERQVFSIARTEGISVINVAKAFAADPNPRQYWPKPTSHYGPNGYALVARTVLAAIPAR